MIRELPRGRWVNVDMEIQGLVVRAQAGDRDAFGELYERLSPKVYNYLYYHLNGRAQLAEDLSEEVFVKVLEKLGRYQDRGLPFSAWVFRIAHNHLIDHVRAQPKQGIVSIDDCLDLPEQRSERTLDLALTHTELAAAITRLTEDQRRVVVLRFLQGMSTAETARMLGKTEDAVKKLQARGLQVLKKTLTGTRQALAVA
jgi:RNA polymerase sigma-70 factor, ECF subfamily